MSVPEVSDKTTCCREVTVLAPFHLLAGLLWPDSVDSSLVAWKSFICSIGIAQCSNSLAEGAIVRNKAVPNLSPEQHDMGFWLMNCVVHPASRLLYTNASPLVLQRQGVEYRLLLFEVVTPPPTSVNKRPFGKRAAISVGSTTCLQSIGSM